MENDQIKADILKNMICRTKYSVTDILNNFNLSKSKEEVGSSRLMALLCQLDDNGKVQRMIENGHAYFTITPTVEMLAEESKKAAEKKKVMDKLIAECEKNKKLFHEKLVQRMEEQKQINSAELDKYIVRLRDEVTALESEINALGKFKFKERREKTDDLTAMKIKIQKLSNADVFQSANEEMEIKLKTAEKNYGVEIDAYLKRRYPKKDSNNCLEIEKYTEDEKYTASNIPTLPNTDIFAG